jgi:hypothetical protein
MFFTSFVLITLKSFKFVCSSRRCLLCQVFNICWMNVYQAGVYILKFLFFIISEKLAGELVVMFVSELALKVENRTVILFSLLRICC